MADMPKKEADIKLPPGTKVPDHVALILDGNRRWARARGLPAFEGHRAGFEAGMKVARAARNFGVHTFTVWGFSTENWERSAEEIECLMKLFRKMVDVIREEAVKENIRFVHLGRKDRFPRDLVSYISQVEKETRGNTKHVLNVALDYGGHDEILRAVKKVIKDKIPADRLDEKMFEKYLDTGDQPYPYVDLFIRTSGEQRSSGLLPWQMHYAEFYWELDHLPDMTPEKLREAVVDYSRRRRRFGGNDAEKHLKFDPKIAAKLEIDLGREVKAGNGKRFRDLVVSYIREQYGLSRTLAKEGGKSLAKALVYRKQEDWVQAKEALQGLYEIVKKNLGLALEPELAAQLQVSLWQNGDNEEDYRKLYAETYRFSDFQASKSAHLAYLANNELKKNNFRRARDYLEKFYEALKERVA